MAMQEINRKIRVNTGIKRNMDEHQAGILTSLREKAREDRIFFSSDQEAHLVYLAASADRGIRVSGAEPTVEHTLVPNPATSSVRAEMIDVFNAVDEIIAQGKAE